MNVHRFPRNHLGRSTSRLRRVAPLCGTLALAVSLSLGGCGEVSNDVATAPATKTPTASVAPSAAPSSGLSNESTSASTSRENAAATSNGEAWMTSGARTATSADGTYIVRWEPIGGLIPDAEPFSIAVEAVRRDGAELASDVIVMADAEMPHHGHGMNLVPTVRPGPLPGTFLVDGLLLHMSGRWTFAIDIEEHGILERAQWVLDVE